MKRLITLLLVYCMLFNGGFVFEAKGAENTQDHMYGDYLPQRVSAVGDTEGRGYLHYPDREVLFDFDSGRMPDIKVDGGTAEISNKYYMTENNSLKWSSSVDSSIKFNVDVDLDLPWYTYHNYAFTIGLLQEQKPADGVRAFEVTVLSNGGEFTKSIMYLHKTGWSMELYKLEDARYNKVNISGITVKQIAGPAGDIYIDNVMIYVYNNDHGLTSKTRGLNFPIEYEDLAKDIPTTPLTDEEIKGFETIAGRIVGEITKVPKLDDEVMTAMTQLYERYNIKEAENGLVNGVNPLYYSRAVPGETQTDASGFFMWKENQNLCQSYKTLGMSYARVEDPQQKELLGKYLVGLGKLALTYGGMPNSWYNGIGFVDGCYYGKEALEKGGILEAITSQIKKQYGVDAMLYTPHELGNYPSRAIFNTPFTDKDIDTSNATFEWKTSADDLNTGCQSTLLCILIGEDNANKSRDLRLFSDFMDKLLLNYAPNDNGTLKPDGSLFHHWANRWDNYGWNGAWKGMCEYIYYFSGTPFRASDGIMERMKMFSNVRFNSLSSDGSIGNADYYLRHGSGTFMNLARSGMPDGSLEVDPYYASQWLYYGKDSSLNSNRQLRDEYLDMGIKPADAPRANTTLSYGKMNIHNRGNWAFTTRSVTKQFYTNEYIRNGFLFYSINGISFNVDGLKHPMLKKISDTLSGRFNSDTGFNNGYNINRGTGVTAAAVSDDQLAQIYGQKGSDDFVGGLSTQNGNGIFVTRFDGSKVEKLAATIAGSLKFIKSYFYFDDKVVSLASDIGYAKNNLVTTGLTQDELSNGSYIKTSNGEAIDTLGFDKTFNSNDVPWFINNNETLGIYLYKDQKYKITRGRQEFLSTAGDFESAYLLHDAKSVNSGSGGYEYLMYAMPSQEKMKQLDDTSYEILKRDSDAHIVHAKEENATGYAIFNKSATLKGGKLMSVNHPLTVMEKEIDDGKGLNIAVADPDLNMDRTAENPWGWSLPSYITLTLKGRWHLKEQAHYDARENAKLGFEYTPDGNTKLSLVLKDGLTEEFLLENLDDKFVDEIMHELIFTKGSSDVIIDGKTEKLMVPTYSKNNELYAYATDIAKLLGGKASYNEKEKRLYIYYGFKVLNLTEGSKIATVDNNIILLKDESFTDNDKFMFPLSLLEQALDCGISRGENTISCLQSNADWKSWRTPPPVKQKPYLNSISVDGEPLDFNLNNNNYLFEVKDGREDIPVVDVQCDEQYTYTVTNPQMLPGVITIHVQSKEEKYNTNDYVINVTYPKFDYKITASDVPQPENGPENSRDANYETYWASNLDGGAITFDAGKMVTFDALAAAFIQGDTRIAKFDIEVSEDGEKWTTMFKGQASGTTLAMEKFKFAPTEGRYIRLVGHGNNKSEWFSVTEIEIYKH